MVQLELSNQEFDVLITTIQETLNFNKDYEIISNGLMNEAQNLLEKMQKFLNETEDVEETAENTLKIIQQVIEERKRNNCVKILGYRTICSNTFYKLMYDHMIYVKFTKLTSNNEEEITQKIREHNNIIKEAKGPYSLLVKE